MMKARQIRTASARCVAAMAEFHEGRLIDLFGREAGSGLMGEFASAFARTEAHDGR